MHRMVLPNSTFDVRCSMFDVQRRKSHDFFRLIWFALCVPLRPLSLCVSKGCDARQYHHTRQRRGAADFGKRGDAKTQSSQRRVPNRTDDIELPAFSRRKFTRHRHSPWIDFLHRPSSAFSASSASSAVISIRVFRRIAPSTFRDANADCFSGKEAHDANLNA